VNFRFWPPAINGYRSLRLALFAKRLHDGASMNKRILPATLGLCLFAALACPEAAVSNTAPAAPANKPEIFPQIGFTGPVNAIAFSPDGKLLASGGQDHTIELWDVADRREWRLLGGHSGGVNSLAFSPNGKILASGSDDKTVKLWDVTSGRELRTLNEHSSGVVSIAFSPDGKVLASSGYDSKIIVSDTASGRQLRAIASEGAGPIAIAPDGKTVAAGDLYSAITLWDIASGHKTRTISGHANSIVSLAFSPDGNLLVSASKDNTIKFWNTHNGQAVHTLQGGKSGGFATAIFSPNGKTLASANDDRIIQLWDVASGRQTGAMDTGAQGSLAFSPDGGMLASGEVKSVALWDVTNRRQIGTLNGNSAAVLAVAVSPDGKVLASVDEDEAIALWDTENGGVLRSLGGPGDAVAGVFSPDGRTLASGDTGGNVTLWDVASGKISRTLAGHTADVLSVAFSPDGKLLGSGSSDNTIKLWDGARLLRTLNTQEQQRMLTFGNPLSGPVPNTPDSPGIDNQINSVAFSPDGKLLASGGLNGIVKLWSTENGATQRVLNNRPDYESKSISSVVFSPNGRLLVAGDTGGAIMLWDAASGRLLRTVPGGADREIKSIAFSPDSKSLASGNSDNTITIWDAASGRALRTLAGHSGAVNSVAFSPNGKLLYSGSADGTAKVWDLASGEQHATLVAFGDGSYITVTPQGYFDSSSEKAEDSLNVRINNRVFGISSFRATFYRPDLVKRALSGQSLTQFGSIDNIKLSPVIQLGELPPSTTATNIKMTLQLTNGGGGFGPVRVFWNGTVIQQDNDVPPSGATFTRNYTMPLLGGDNALRATASNANSTMWSDVRTSVVANLPPIGKTATAHGTLYAIVAGIQDFPKAPGNDLSFPNADAALIAKTLTTKAAPLFKTVNVQVLTGPAETDKGHLEQSLKSIGVTAHAGDEFVFYVASHGIVVGGQYYLITSNVSDTRTLGTTAIGATELSALLANIHVDKKLVILDTCDAGAANSALSAPSTTGGLNAQTATTILARDYGFTVLAATTSNQEALDGGYQNHGLFAYVVADGLSGKAADQASGIVSSFLLADYVNSQVPVLAKTALHRKQQSTSEKSGQSFAVTKVK
jgi:WD40 repeat protein